MWENQNKGKDMFEGMSKGEIARKILSDVSREYYEKNHRVAPTSTVDYYKDPYCYVVYQLSGNYNPYNAMIRYNLELNQWHVYETISSWY